VFRIPAREGNVSLASNYPTSYSVGTGVISDFVVAGVWFWPPSPLRMGGTTSLFPLYAIVTWTKKVVPCVLYLLNWS